MALVSSTAALTLDLPPSCIAFCPSKPQFFVVGTYLLHPKEQQSSGTNTSDAAANDGVDDSIQHEEEAGQNGQQLRTGSLILFRLDPEDDVITRVVTEPTKYAILDLQWAPHAGQVGDLLAVATSTGLLAFYRLDPCRDGRLALFSTHVVSEFSTLVLSLAWHPRRPDVIGLSLSDGSVCICESSDGQLWSENAIIHQSTIHSHSLEAWTLAFSDPNSTNVLSGGDDCILQYSTINSFNQYEVHWQDRKLHGAGITAILPLSPTLAVTGSYDDHVRLISYPRSGKRQCLAEANLGGGVWRLRKLSTQSLVEAEGDEPEITSLVILASCMHAGSRVVNLCKGEDGWAFEVLARFEEHRSMNYGADYQPSEDAGKRIVSISFYDKLMCLWKYEGEGG